MKRSTLRKAKLAVTCCDLRARAHIPIKIYASSIIQLWNYTVASYDNTPQTKINTDYSKLLLEAQTWVTPPDSGVRFLAVESLVMWSGSSACECSALERGEKLWNQNDSLSPPRSCDVGPALQRYTGISFREIPANASQHAVSEIQEKYCVKWMLSVTPDPAQ